MSLVPPWEPFLAGSLPQRVQDQAGGPPCLESLLHPLLAAESCYQGTKPAVLLIRAQALWERVPTDHHSPSQNLLEGEFCPGERGEAGWKMSPLRAPRVKGDTPGPQSPHPAPPSSFFQMTQDTRKSQGYKFSSSSFRSISLSIPSLLCPTLLPSLSHHLLQSLPFSLLFLPICLFEKEHPAVDRGPHGLLVFMTCPPPCLPELREKYNRLNFKEDALHLCVCVCVCVREREREKERERERRVGEILHAKSLQWCPTLRDPMDCSPPGSSVHGILQARILE